MKTEPEQTTTEMKILKFFTPEDKKLILIPSADGLNFISNGRPTFKGDKGSIIPLAPCQHKIAGQNVNAFCCDFDSSILFIDYKLSVTMNETTFRVYTSGQVNYYLKLPYSTGKPSYEAVVT